MTKSKCFLLSLPKITEPVLPLTAAHFSFCLAANGTNDPFACKRGPNSKALPMLPQAAKRNSRDTGINITSAYYTNIHLSPWLVTGTLVCGIQVCTSCMYTSWVHSWCVNDMDMHHFLSQLSRVSWGRQYTTAREVTVSFFVRSHSLTHTPAVGRK